MPSYPDSKSLGYERYKVYVYVYIYISNRAPFFELPIVSIVIPLFGIRNLNTQRKQP